MYYHKITEYEIKCCMHAHHVPPRAPSSRSELYRRKTLFFDDFPIFFYYPNGTWTHPPTSKLFLDFLNFFNFAKPLIPVRWLLSILFERSIDSSIGLGPMCVRSNALDGTNACWWYHLSVIGRNTMSFAARTVFSPDRASTLGVKWPKKK